MLQDIELFSGLSNAELQTLELFCQQRTFLKDEILFKKGEEATAMYVIVDGLVEVYDDLKVLGTVGKGGMVGEMAMFTEPKVRSASVKAMQDSNVLVILHFSIMDLMKKHPSIYDKLNNIVEQRTKQNSGK